MITVCHIVLTVVTCTVDPTTPKPSPAEAAAIFVASLGPTNVPEAVRVRDPLDRAPDLAYDRSRPFTGSFAPTWVPTDRRLDGSSLFDPSMIYGWPAYARYGGYGGYGFTSGRSGRVGGVGESSGRAMERAARSPAVTSPVASPARSVVAPAGGGGVARRRP